jgi:prepilin-type N-terminal cleavage/methylation domain
MKKGFTLIELLVVISIISLLASVVMSTLNTSRSKALVAKQQEEVIQSRNSIAVNRLNGTHSYVLPVNMDHYFIIDEGTFALSNITDGDGYVPSQSMTNRLSEVFPLATKDGSAAAIYAYFRDGWRKLGTPASQNFSSTALTKYFIIRNGATSREIIIILPDNVTYAGSTAINGTPRPW